MLEILAAGFLLVLGFMILGLAWAVLSLVFWVILLPFKLLGLAFRGVAVLLALPFLLAFGLVAAVVFGAGMIVFLLPAVPLALLVLAVVWLVRRRGHGPASATS